MRSRRDILWGAAGGVLAGMLPVHALARPGPALGTPRAFDFATLIEEARLSAERAYEPPHVPHGAVLDRIDYDAHWRIRYRDDAGLPLGAERGAVQFFHLGRYAREPVDIHLVEGSTARRLRYAPGLFDMPANSPARALGDEGGFAGLRVMRPGGLPDWLSFLGASYFRADGPDAQYGLSARGLAIDTGLSRPEEFPRFTAFWIGPAERPGEDVVIHARLEGPSVAGAYRFGASRQGGQGQRIDVSARLFLRGSVERLGIAPLTSMFWYSETSRAAAQDWRPEIHDSDGLALETGAGERLWRPLTNPDRVVTSSYFDTDPRGFGLIQRDRTFAHYQDDGVFYDRRPSVWVAPQGDWGAGAVQLIEIPTDDETFDNIVAYWTPAAAPPVGRLLAFDYRLDWVAQDPTPAIGQVQATRSGLGGVPGQPRPAGVVKYVIDFEGGTLGDLGQRDGVTAEVSASGGAISGVSARPVVGTARWRIIFDHAGDGAETLRAFLRRGDAALSETWTAPAVGSRGHG